MRRAFLVAAGGLALAVLAGLPQAGLSQADDAAGEYTGGSTTVPADGRNAFSFPAANLPDDERTRFAIGNSFFRRNWVEAPASTTARDGLGPHFIARSCGGCHVQDGRGAPPLGRHGLRHGHAEQPVALLMRLSVPGQPASGAGVVPEPRYGDQFNNAAIPGVRPEGRVQLRWKPLRGRFADGTPYVLRQPVYQLTQLGYGPLAPDLMLSPRLAPQLIGVGLIEAIAEADILANAEQQARLPGPIKGQPNRVWDPLAQRELIGRFGWKANVATVAAQTAGAFAGDIGISSSLHPGSACTAQQADCRAAASGGHGAAHEIDDATLAEVVFYQAVLAPPARRRIADAQVQQGRALFAQAQCAQCHRPSYTTGAGPFPALGVQTLAGKPLSSSALAGQRIWPYTDLLLHDMGPALADGRPDWQANGRQWKTPPLWGTGLIREVNGHQRLLHDGRADGVLEAVLWHGGEAEPSRQQVLRMSAAERAALVAFVESL